MCICYINAKNLKKTHVPICSLRQFDSLCNIAQVRGRAIPNLDAVPYAIKVIVHIRFQYVRGLEAMNADRGIIESQHINKLSRIQY
jgi:hypothetical protein